jgi:MFS family permease
MLTVREFASGIASLPGGMLVDMCRRYWGLLLSLCLGVFGLGSLVIGLLTSTTFDPPPVFIYNPHRKEGVSPNAAQFNYVLSTGLRHHG